MHARVIAGYRVGTIVPLTPYEPPAFHPVPQDDPPPLPANFPVRDLRRHAQEYATDLLPLHLRRFKLDHPDDYTLIRRMCWEGPLVHAWRATKDNRGELVIRTATFALWFYNARARCTRGLSLQDFITLLHHFRVQDSLAAMFGEVDDPRLRPYRGHPDSVYDEMRRTIAGFVAEKGEGLLAPHARRIGKTRQRWKSRQFGRVPESWEVTPTVGDLQYRVLRAADRMVRTRGDDPSTPRNALVVKPPWPRAGYHPLRAAPIRHRLKDDRSTGGEQEDGPSASRRRRKYVSESAESLLNLPPAGGSLLASFAHGCEAVRGGSRAEDLETFISELDRSETVDLCEQIDAALLAHGDHAAVAELRWKLAEESKPRRAFSEEFGVTHDAMRRSWPRIVKIAKQIGRAQAG